MAALQGKHRKASLDLPGHHALCEMNFHQLVSMLPGLSSGVDQWQFSTGNTEGAFAITVTVLDKAPYTTTLAVEQVHSSVETPRIVVRMYHDVSMAEIVSWDQHRYWLPEYPYPNPMMYQPDEKLALNRFLAEWLKFCRERGIHSGKNVTQFS